MASTCDTCWKTKFAKPESPKFTVKPPSATAATVWSSPSPNASARQPEKDVFLPLLLDVPSFAGIRIHSGNYATDSEGCLIIGTGKTTSMVTESKKAFKKVFDMLKTQLDAGDEVWITSQK